METTDVTAIESRWHFKCASGELDKGANGKSCFTYS